MSIPEVEIRGFITWDLPPGGLLETLGGTLPESKVCRGRAVVEAIEAARVAGARALLVTVDSRGGGMAASSAIYRALRRFSDEAHGTVLVHVVGMAASSASTIALAGDLVFLAEDARFIVHGAVAFKAGGEPARVIAEANTAMLAIYLARTRTPLEDLAAWLRYEYDPAADRYHCAELRADAARDLGWADGTATADEVRALAAEIAAGSYSYTRRRLALLERARGAEAAIVTDKLAANAVTAAKVAADAITAAKIAAGELKTSNYAEDGSGNPTAGAKLDHTGVALKCAPANFQIGATLIRDTWFGRVRPAALQGLYYSAGAWGWDLGDPAVSTDWTLSYDATTNRLSVTLDGWAALNFDAVQLVGATPKTWTGMTPGFFVSFYSSFVNGNDLTCQLELYATGIVPDPVNGGSMLQAAKVDWRTSGQRFNLSFLAFTDAGWRW